MIYSRRGFARQLLIFTTVLLLLPTALTFYMLHVIHRTQAALIESDKAKLTQAMRIMDREFKGTFHDVLAARGLENARTRDKARALNEVVKPIIDQVGQAFPNTELGFYSRELDVILDGNTQSYGENFSARRKWDISRTISQQKMVTNVVGMGQSGLLEAYQPLIRNGQVIGAVVARENLREIYRRVDRVQKEAYVVIFAGWVFGIGGFLFLLNRFVSMVIRIKEGLHHLESDLSYRLPAAAGELGDISAAINHLATRLGEMQSYNDIIVNSIDDGIMAIDLQGKLITANPPARRMFDIRDDHLGRDFSSALPVDSPVGRLLLQTLREGTPVKDRLVQWEKEGSTAELVVTTALLFNGQRELVGVVITCRDITEPRRLQARIQRQEKLASLGKFIAGIAHEIRNPLTSISGYIQHWQRNRNPSPQAVSIVCREVMRLNSIVDKLLFFAKPAEARLVPYDVNNLVERVLQFFLATHDERIVIEKELGKNLPLARLDTEQMQQVLVNIIYNALQAMPSGGTLKITTAWDETRNAIEVAVADTGHGIPEENIPRIFDPFFTTKARGSGLGLALAHEIVTAHGGHIEVESKVGRGTTMRVYLPPYKEADTRAENPDRR